MRFKAFALTAAFITVLFVSFTGCFGTASLRGYDEKDTFQKTLPLKRGGTFSLKNINGNITIETWDRKEVDIQAEKAVRGRRENLDRIKIEIETGPRSVAVVTVFPKIPRFNGRVKYEIKVPENVELEKIRTTNGSVYIYGPLGDVDVQSTNGDVTVDGASGRLSFSTTNGSVDASDVQGEIQAHSSNGSIHLEVASITGNISVRTTNGSISLTVDSPDINADLEARTTNGRIYVDFPLTISGGWSSRRAVEGKIGEGGPLISLKTTNGSVKIKK